MKEVESLHPQFNSVPASATAAHLVHILTGLTGDSVAFARQVTVVFLTSRLHGGLVGARCVSVRVPHGCATFQRRDASAGLPEYSQRRWGWFSFTENLNHKPL